MTQAQLAERTGSTAAYTITYIARDGTNVGNVTGNLNAYGSRTFSTAVNADLPANFVANMASKNAGFSAKVTSDKAIVALAETTSIIGTGNLSNWSGDAMASGPTAASNKLYSPAAFRLCPNTPTGQAIMRYAGSELQHVHSVFRLPASEHDW